MASCYLQSNSANSLMSTPAFIRLSQLTGLIQEVVHHAFDGQWFWVVGDITNHSYKEKDERHFFSLVEKAEGANAVIARVDTVAWRPAAAKIHDFETKTGQKFQNGIHVLVRVAVSYSPEYGLKLTLQDIDASFTIGALERHKQEILLRLETECADYIRKEGDTYITRNNQLPLPPVIQHIALITSAGTAGYEDFLHTLQHNAAGYTFAIHNYFTPVQGENNSHLVKQMLLDIYNSRKPYDAVVIIRGGGAQTDFLIFETFALGQIVAKYPIPIISGIGHQRNETIVDLMAHSPTKTPTKAAEYILAHNAAFEDSVLVAKTRIADSARQQLWAHQQAIEPLINNIKTYSRLYITHQNSYLNHFASLFRMMHPNNILKKGFAIIYANGKITTNPALLQPGDNVTIAMATATLEATITSKQPTDGIDNDL